MKNIFSKWTRSTVLAAAGIMTLMMPACNPEPDESDLFTFTGETIDSWVSQDSTLTDFHYIMSRVGYDKMMASYGTYTLFAPINEGVRSYCDSLYNDPEALIPHNGMTDNTVEGLSDSLCLDIVRYHLTNTYRNIVALTDSSEVNTLLGYEFSYKPDGHGSTILNNKAVIVSADHETTNGIVHVIDNVIPRFTRFIGDVLDRSEDYTIFAEALRRTGLADSLLRYTKGTFVYRQLHRDGMTAVFYPANGEGTSGTLDCKVGFTLFAESDEVFRNAGINSFEELAAKANEWYGNAPSWYDYMNERGLTVSTGDDYENRFNALNMFVAYHILFASMSANQLVFEPGSSSYYNYAPDADPYDYYETMLPRTMLKIWEPHHGQGISASNRTLYINRYIRNNTLTDELASQGSNAMHEVVRQGVTIARNKSLQAYNGYVHAINGILLYDNIVPRGVFNERIRVNCTSIFPELINNKFRYWSANDGNIPSGHDAGRLGIPAKYFDNAVFFNENICFNYNLHSDNRCFQSDQMQFWGLNYDWAFRLPAVPSGLYEVRVVYAPMSYGSFMQYFLGNSSSITSMQPLGLPFDARIAADDPRVGLTDAKLEEDQGIATDMAMRNRGYMRGPYSYCGHAGDKGWSKENNGRFEFGSGGMTVRFILGRVELKQGDDNWLRVKNLEEGNTGPVGLDYVELVPASVVDNQQYIEDWY